MSIEIKTENGCCFSTSLEHKVLVKGGTWKPVADLKIGDIVSTSNGFSEVVHMRTFQL